MIVKTPSRYAAAALAAVSLLIGWETACHRRPAATHSPAPAATAARPPVSSGEAVAVSLPDNLRALADAANRVPEAQHDAAWATLIQSFPPTDIPQLLKALAPATDDASVLLRQLLLRRWAAADPAAAAAWAAGFADPAVQLESLQQVALVWSQSNLSLAIQWAQQLPDGSRQTVCLALAYEAARTDPQTALTLAMDLPANAARADLVAHATAQWATGDPAAAAAWAVQITDPALREQVVSAIATEWGGNDPAAAANLALNSLSTGKAQNDAIVGIVQRWAQNDPAAAAQWATAFPSGDLQSAALENVIKPWALRDSQAAGAWLNTLAAGPVKDAAVADYATALAPTAPALATEWAASIAQDALRERELADVITNWLARDTTTARNWIAQSALSPAEKNQFLGSTGK